MPPNAKRPRARIVVAPRSFLDAGTEVVPGERKFTDYAFPPSNHFGVGAVTNTGGRVGWDRSAHAARPVGHPRPELLTQTQPVAERERVAGWHCATVNARGVRLWRP